MPGVVPTAKPYCVFPSVWRSFLCSDHGNWHLAEHNAPVFLCRRLSRNPAIPTHVDEDRSVSFRLIRVGRNTQQDRINIVVPSRSRSLGVVVCLSGRSNVTQGFAALILGTSTNFLYMRQRVSSFCRSYRSHSDTMSGHRRRTFSDARRCGLGGRTEQRHHPRETGKTHRLRAVGKCALRARMSAFISHSATLQLI